MQDSTNSAIRVRHAGAAVGVVSYAFIGLGEMKDVQLSDCQWILVSRISPVLAREEGVRRTFYGTSEALSDWTTPTSICSAEAQA